MKQATIIGPWWRARKTNELIAVTPSVSKAEGPMKGVRFLIIDVPNGSDDVKKLCKKVLDLEGRKYIFIGWSSANKMFFREKRTGLNSRSPFEPDIVDRAVPAKEHNSLAILDEHLDELGDERGFRDTGSLAQL